MRIRRVGPKPPARSNKSQRSHPMITPGYSFIRCRNTGMQVKKIKIEPVFSMSVRTSGRSPRRSACARRSPPVCVCAALPLQQTHNISLLPRTDEVKGGNSKGRAAVQSQVAAFPKKGRGYAGGRGQPPPHADVVAEICQ